MDPAVSAVAGSALTVLVGMATVVATWSGVFTSYVKSGLRWPLVVSGLVLIGAGVISIVANIREPGHRRTVEGVGALLVVFVVALALTPPPLGADAAAARTPNRLPATTALEPIAIADASVDSSSVAPDPAVSGDGEASNAPGVDAPVTASVPEPSTAFPISLFDLVSYSIFLPEEVMDEPLEIVGFVAAEPDIPGAFRLTRYLISCCAADSFPLQVALVGATDIPDQDQWLVVEAIWHGDVTGVNQLGEGVPVLEVISMTPIDPPAEPYEY